MWGVREGLLYQNSALCVSVARAKEMADGADPGANGGGNEKGPVLLIDHGDNCTSGGTCDTMGVFEEAVSQGLTDLVFGPICDPEAVNTLFAAGIGSIITLPIGNKVELTSLGLSRSPVMLEGKILYFGDGEYTKIGRAHV